MKPLTTILAILMVSMSLKADRNPPAKIAPIECESLTISAKFEKDEHEYSVYVLAKKVKSDKVEWKTKIYQGIFDQSLETDVQEIYLESLSISKSKTQLIATDEAGQKYSLNCKTGSLLEPKAPKIYK